MKKPMRNKKIPPIVAIFAAAIAVFSAANFSQAEDSDLIITEIMYDQSENIDSEQTQWIEMVAKKDIVFELKTDNQVKNFYLCARKNKTSGSCTFYAVYSPEEIQNISAGSFVIFTTDPDTVRNVYNLTDDTIILKTSGSFSLLDKDSSTNHPFISYSQDNKITLHEEIFYGDFFDKKESGHSLERINFNEENTKNNWRESCEEGGTPGEEPETCEIESDPAEEASTEDSSDINDKTDAPKKVYSKNLKITELLPNPSSDENTGEFTEIYNADPKEIIELSGWKLEDKTGNSYPLPDISLQPGEYRAFYRNSSKFSLNNTGSEEIFLKNPDGEMVDYVPYSGTVKEDYAYALSVNDFLWTSAPTPGEKNVFDAPSIKSSIEASMEDSSDSDAGAATDGNVYLNEIMPNPKDGSDNEYIEIANGGGEPVDLFGWRLKDISKSKGYQFKEHIIFNPGEFLAIYRPDSKIALNNSAESVYLYDSKNEIVSSISFEKSQKDASYNFDGKTWKWSKYLTPGKKNKFDSEPSVKITKPKYAYKDLFTEFSAKAKDKETKNLKYAWDFGDGKKSNLAKSSHKYLDTGKYTVTLSVTDDSQTVEKSFSLKVKKYPQPNLEIVKIVPNPAGNDSEGEIVEIKNNSKKKIDLRGWKIATGSGEKIYNHPISGEISVDPNATKTITREFSKFSLNNKAGKVGLVMPDGKVIDEIAYSKEKISEDEAYVKENGEWQWIEPRAPDENTDESVADEKSESEEVAEEDIANNGEVLGAAKENMPVSPNYRSYFSPEDAFIFLTDIGFFPSATEINYCPMHQTSSLDLIVASLI